MLSMMMPCVRLVRRHALQPRAMMSSLRAVNTSRAPRAVGPYSQAVVANGMVFASGCLGILPQTGDYAEPRTIQSETAQVLENLKSVLEESGSGLPDVIKCTVLLRDMDDFDEVNKVYAQYFREPFPARVAYAVRELPKGAQVEIDAVALQRE